MAGHARGDESWVLMLTDNDTLYDLYLLSALWSMGMITGIGKREADIRREMHFLLWYVQDGAEAEVTCA